MDDIGKFSCPDSVSFCGSSVEGPRLCLRYKTHRIHGTNGIFTYIYHKKSTKCEVNTPYMD